MANSHGRRLMFSSEAKDLRRTSVVKTSPELAVLLLVVALSSCVRPPATPASKTTEEPRVGAAGDVKKAEPLSDEDWFQQAKSKNTAESYDDYLNEYPEGAHALEAKQLKEPLLFERARSQATVEGYSEYLDDYPDGKYVAEAISLREALRPKPFREGEGRSKPHANLALLGHQGHGKTTLASAITRVLSKAGKTRYRSYKEIESTPPTKARGMVLGVAYIEFETQMRHYALTDFRNREDHIKGLLLDAGDLAGVILVISATEGPTDQTREQLRLAHQLGVPAIVVFLNKVDLIKDQKRLDQVEADSRDLLTSSGFPGDRIPVIRGSALGALNGQQDWEKPIHQLMNAVDNDIPLPQKAIAKPFLMPIEDVFAVQGEGIHASGRIESGIIKVNEEVEIVGIDATRKVTVTSVQMFKKHLDQAQEGDTVSLVLSGEQRAEVKRGQVIAKPASITRHTKFKAAVYMHNQEEGGPQSSFSNGYRPQFYFRTTDATGHVKLPKGLGEVAPGQNTELDVELETPLALVKGLQFAVREAGRTVGFGRITTVLN